MTCNLGTFHPKSRTRTNRLAFLSLSILVSSLVGGIYPRWAQADTPPIVVDSSLGDEQSQIMLPNNPGSNRIDIEGGAQRGSNLFHSFERFNVLEGQGVYFKPNDMIDNVLTRVVGSDPSNILGTLGVDDSSSANLWFVNPNGILFGENARLNLDGSFYATTGDAIPTGSGVFSTVASQRGQLLEFAPDALFSNYLTADSGTIETQGALSGRASIDEVVLAGGAILSTARVFPRQNTSLSLIAYNNIETGELRIRGGNLGLTAIRGNISVGDLNTRAMGDISAGDIDIIAAGYISAATIRSGNLDLTSMRGNVTVGDLNTRLVDGVDASDIAIIAAGNIIIDDIKAQARSLEDEAVNGGNVTLRTTAGGNIRIQGNINTESTIQPEDTANDENAPVTIVNTRFGGNVTLTTESGGNIAIDGTIRTISGALSGNSINAGNIAIETMAAGDINATTIRGGKLDLAATRGNVTVGELNTRFADGVNSGDIEIIAAGDITIDEIKAQAINTDGNTGNGGDVILRTTAGGNIRIQENINTESTIETESPANDDNALSIIGNAGSGGDVVLTTASGGNITLSGPIRTVSRAFNGNAAMGGSITLDAMGRGDITNNDVLSVQSASTIGTAGMGGDITISTDDGNIVNRGALRAQSGTLDGNARRGGSITIEALNGSITNASDVITSSASNEGNAGRGGDISLTASGNILNQGLLSSYSFSQTGRARNGGSIDVISNGGGSITNRGSLRSLSASNGGDTGRSGDITISAVGNGIITNDGALNAQALANGGGAAGSGGDITLTTHNGDILGGLGGNPNGNGGSLNSRSVARAGNAGDAGNILVTSIGGNIVLNDYIDAKSYALLSGIAGNGGNVTITTAQGSILGDAVAGQSTNIITSSVSSENAAIAVASIGPQSDDNTDEMKPGSGTVELSAGARISGFNIFTLSDVGTSGDVNITGTGDLTIEDLQVIANEDIVGGDFSFNEDSLFPANLARRTAENSDLRIIVNTPRSGIPGNVTISSDGSLTAVNLLVSNSANSPVNAGDIRIYSPADIILINSQFETDSVGTGGDDDAGNGGSIELGTTRRIEDDNTNNADNFAADNADNVISENAQTIILDNTALITRTTGGGETGDITVESDDYVLLLNGSLLLADAEENQDGGNITINTNRVIASPDGNNNIIANATSGDGGNLIAPGATFYGFELQDRLTTAQLRNSRSNDISTRSELGQDGSITLNDITETPNQTESEELDDSFSTPEQLISNSCISPNNTISGRFTIPGAGDLPTTPEDATASVYSLGDVQSLAAVQIRSPQTEVLSPQTAPASDSRGNSAPSAVKKWQLGDPVVEPESIARLADGRIVFGQDCSAL